MFILIRYGCSYKSFPVIKGSPVLSNIESLPLLYNKFYILVDKELRGSVEKALGQYEAQ